MTTSGTTDVAHAASLQGEWARFGAFLRRPALPDKAPLPRLASVIAVLRLLVLDLILMAILLLIAGIVTSSGVELPETALAGMELTPMLAIIAVLGAPVAEEIVFRSWLSGRAGHMLALIVGIVAGIAASGLVAALSLVGPPQPGPDGMVKYFGQVMLYAGPVGFVASIPVIYLTRGRPAMHWFARIFPLLLWVSAAVFAAAHLTNFADDNILKVAPLVLPQFTIGLFLAYSRVNYGLWSSMLLHLLHNGCFIGLVLLANAMI